MPKLFYHSLIWDFKTFAIKVLQDLQALKVLEAVEAEEALEAVKTQKSCPGEYP